MAAETPNKILLRNFKLTSLSVDNKVSVYLITLMIIIFGVGSYNSMPKESFPEVPFPEIYINTPYFGNSAADIENLITRPIENELSTITEIKNVTSSSMQDFSVISAEFSSDVDMELASRKVKDAVDRAKQNLPNDMTTEPEVIEINLSELPIMTVNLSGNFSNDELRSYAEYLEDKIENLKEVSSVALKGTMDRELSINVDINKMQSLQVSFGDIENAVKSENVTMSGGEILENEFRRNIRVIGEFKKPSDLENLIVKSENQRPIYLKEIADVQFGYEDQTSIARSDRLPVVSLDVIKKKGENLLIAADKINVLVHEAETSVFPENLKVAVFNDMSHYTRSSVDNLENSIISGVILVTLILLFFLGLRNAMFVGMAIPLSMLMGILILHAIGYTLNMVVLFSLILALGMLVDNAIVVVENVFRYRSEGYSKNDSAKYGTAEVALPIIASTATTLAAFIPLAFWPGLMGSFMRYLPITLIAVLSASLFVALVINPVLTASFMKVDKRIDDTRMRRRKRNRILWISASIAVLAIIFHISGFHAGRNLLGIAVFITLINYFMLRPLAFAFQSSVMPWLEHLYDKFIRLALFKYIPLLVFFGSFLLLFITLGLLRSNMPKVELFPSADPTYVNAFIELPMGKDIKATDDLMREIEQRVENDIASYSSIVDAVLAQIGENTSDPNSGPDFGTSPNKARLTVSFIPDNERGELSSGDVMNIIRKSVQGFPGAKIIVDKNANGPPQEKPLNIELKGENINTLASLSEEVIAFVNRSNIDGIEGLKADVQIGKPEMQVKIDREAARRYEVSTFAIADVIRTAVFGKEISKFKQGEDEYPIILRSSEQYRYNIDDILNQKITFRNPANGQIAQVPISAVAQTDYTSTYNAVRRKNQERMITISSNVLEGYTSNEVVEAVQFVMADYEMPEGYTYMFTGQQQQQAEEMNFLISALGVAVFGIFLIIVMQFNSIISPFIIIFSVVLSTIGVFLGYLVNDMNIVIVMTGVGIISLAGIVVNNAIVLIDYTNLVVQRKRESLGLETMNDMSIEDVKESIVLGGATRLRPVLLTAITTVLGLIPLALGLNINFGTLITELDPQFFVGGDNAVFWGTMAWTVIYGLVFATFLTLIVVPVMYWLAFRAKKVFIRLIIRTEKTESTQS